jgi:hypothetical protein
MKTAALLLASLSAADASTRVAVLEFGKGGVIQRTTTSSQDATAGGVVSFWNALHRTGRRQLQHAGMSMVPDMWKQADAGLIIGLSGSVNLEEMSHVASLLSEEANSANVVGHMEVSGNHCSQMMNNIDDVQFLEDASSLQDVAVSKATSGLAGVSTMVTASNAAQVDEQVAALLGEIQRQATEKDTTIVVHLVVDEDESFSRRRRLQERRLEDEQGEGENQNQNNNENQNNNNNAEGDNQDNNQYPGYYAYGYYNAYDEWVTPYKTMFQIQYFNVVLWTAVCLFAALFYALYLMIHMPLQADTLLFGESAKMIGDD